MNSIDRLLVGVVGVAAVFAGARADGQDDLEGVDLLAPISVARDAFTEVDYTAAKLDYERQTLIDAYREHGRRSDAWDERVIALLKEVALHFSSAPGFKSREAIIELAEPLVAEGCDDPMVLYCYGAMLQDYDWSEATQDKSYRLLVDSYEGLVELGYPANRRFSAARRLWRYRNAKERDSEEAKAAKKAMIREALAVVRQDDGVSPGYRKLITLIDDVHDLLSPSEREAFYEQAKELEDEHPFLVNYFGGKWHNNVAWEARGGGFAHKVTEEGWRLFNKHLGEAKSCYEKAWRASPDRPEVADAMIGIAMGHHGDEPLKEMRLWFDRAVEAQFDYRPAYHSMLYGLMPRWHGDHDLMYQFGLLCKETECYDTDVPYMLCEALWRVCKDDQNRFGVRTLAKPGVYDEAAEVCRRYSQQARSEDDKVLAHWWRSVHLGFMYAAGRVDEASDLLDAMDEKIDPDAFERFRLQEDGVILSIRLATAPEADAIQEVVSGEGGASLEERVEDATELLEDDSLHPMVRRFLASKLQGMRWQAEFNEGGVVSLKADADLRGWGNGAGDWEPTDEGGLKGVSHRNGMLVLCDLELGSRWELQGEWEYGESPYRSWYAGMFVYSGRRPAYEVTYHPKEEWVAAGPFRRLDDHHVPFKHEGEVVPFRVRFDEGFVDVWIGEEHVIQEEELPYWEERGPVHVGFGAHYTWAGSELTYRKLTAKALD